VKRVPFGPFLVALGVFGGGLLWMMLIGLRFEYLVTVVYSGYDPGEAIWALDPVFTLIAAVPGVLLSFAGLIMSFRSRLGTSRQSLNLFYIGEICLLIALITSMLGFLGTSGLVVEAVTISTVLMGLIVFTGTLHILSVALTKSITIIESLNIVRNTAIILLIEFIVLVFIVTIFHLYTWSLIRSTTLVITSSGILGLLLLIPGFLSMKRKGAAEVTI
jgi:hypothetical protein